jgi:putative hydrolase of HD superfamily
MHDSELDGTLDFLRAAEALKNVTRTAWTSGGHPEHVASHSWRLCLMALVFEDEFPDVDFARLARLCIVHDLGEAIGGDIPAIHQVAGTSKAAQERRDLLELLRPLPSHKQAGIVALWDEYEAATSAEARLAKALDKLETIMQHNQGKNPADFDYRFNLQYGKRFTTGDPLIERIRAILDRETERLAEERASEGKATAPNLPPASR